MAIITGTPNDALRYTKKSRIIYDHIDNYIYLHHTSTLLMLPVYPENLQDQSSANFSSTQPLGRSAPIYSYTHSGPRQISFSFTLHRDMMNQANQWVDTNIQLGEGEDYVDAFIRCIQAAALPRYSSSDKMIDPPLVTVRVSDDVCIKGVVNGGVGVDYRLPINKMNKYAVVGVNFQVSEVDPYDADLVLSIGSYRDTGEIKLSTSGERNNFIASGITNKLEMI